MLFSKYGHYRDSADPEVQCVVQPRASSPEEGAFGRLLRTRVVRTAGMWWLEPQELLDTFQCWDSPCRRQ